MVRRPFVRGCVVVRERDGQYGVVWSDDGVELALLLIVQPEHAHAGDVLLDRAGALELLTFRVPLPGAVVRPDLVLRHGRGWRAVGEMTVDRMAEVKAGLIRVETDSHFVRKWGGERTHRARARSNSRSSLL